MKVTDGFTMACWWADSIYTAADHECLTCYICAWLYFIDGNHLDCPCAWDCYNTDGDCLMEK